MSMWTPIVSGRGILVALCGVLGRWKDDHSHRANTQLSNVTTSAPAAP